MHSWIVFQPVCYLLGGVEKTGLGVSKFMSIYIKELFDKTGFVFGDNNNLGSYQIHSLHRVYLACTTLDPVNAC